MNANFTQIIGYLPYVATGDVLYASSSTTVAALTGNITATKKYLSQTGNGAISAAPSWAQVAFSDLSGTIASAQITSSALTAPTVQKFTSTGTATGWLFTITSGNATVGATYTNNSNTYTVLYTVASSTLLWASGTGATSGGTLTKSTGTGDASITFSAKVAIATYTTPVSPRTPLYLDILEVGAGGGGASTGGSPGTGNTGGATSFADSFCAGGAGGTAPGVGGAGGATASVGSLTGFGILGGYGGASGSFASGGSGGIGGVSALGGAGYGALGGANTAGLAAKANSGSGGGGAGILAGSGSGGGGAGAFVKGVITSPAASYSYVVGAKGTGNTAGTNAGGDGGDGLIVVTEYYQ